ncbi:MAG: carboxylating nicotinate-nucleotide diphosphorylase [Planctomycetes bacterium]|nr:carboxylating nicotinate-nucleotide diphosphorylase [Planctomycetota bacterium]
MVIPFGIPERQAAGALIELAWAEDLGDSADLTCRALIDEGATGGVDVVARESGVLAGSPVARMVFDRIDPDVQWESQLSDGEHFQCGTCVATLCGPLKSLLSGERTALNFLTHLSGVATLTRKFVERVAGTNARILDTRKTTPGYRLLEKYAVRAGGGSNHRFGLYDGILIKDNHLAAWSQAGNNATIADAVRRARQSLQTSAHLPVEVEVDTLDQLTDALCGLPDIVLLDNMDPATLRRAVEIRDASAQGVQLEASGGVTLETVRAIAETGVERISIGALTHSAAAVDLAFDWQTPSR